MIYDQTIVVVRPAAAASRYGDAAANWSTATRTTVAGVSVQPAYQEEPTDTGRDPKVTGFRVIGADGADIDITAADHVEYQDETYEVEGEIARWPALSGAGVDHCEFGLRRVAG